MTEATEDRLKGRVCENDAAGATRPLVRGQRSVIVSLPEGDEEVPVRGYQPSGPTEGSVKRNKFSEPEAS